jgi:hypothetical protein
MRLIRAAFAVEVDRRIPRIIRRVTGLILPLETLLASPGLQQGPVDREVLGRQQAPAAGLRDDVFEERSGDVALPQPVTILREGRRRLVRIVRNG